MVRHPTSPRGFTLVEVLVALLVMALLAALAWRGVDGMARGKLASAQLVDEALLGNTVLAQLETDLLALHDSALVPALGFDGRTLRLTRRAAGGVQVVAWRLNGAVWQRWAGPATSRSAQLQDSWLASQQLLGNEPGTVTLFEGVSSVQFFFFRGNAWTNAQSAGDAVVPQAAPAAPAAPASGASAPGAGVPPPGPVREQLPQALRLELMLSKGRLTRDWLLPPQMP
jgi:general secretion pathway protein J